MPTSAKIITDSINPNGQRLTTFVLEYPRYILAELNTHRMFSRCTASSRAIPVQKRIDMLMSDPVIPHWGMNKPGMQSDVDADQETASAATQIWLDTMLAVIDSAKALVDLGIHKQAVNRLLEPFVHVQTIVSATDWANFFALRCHKKAAPEMQKLAHEMYDAFIHSTPVEAKWGEWHLPFIFHQDICKAYEDSDKDAACMKLVRASIARCARVSYNNHDGTRPDIETDIALYEKLVGSFPRHASATEHAARACQGWSVTSHRNGMPESTEHDHANFKGWHQHRKDIPFENITRYPFE